MGYIHLLYPHCEYISPGWFSLNDENDGIHPPRKNRETSRQNRKLKTLKFVQLKAILVDFLVIFPIFHCITYLTMYLFHDLVYIIFFSSIVFILSLFQ